MVSLFTGTVPNLTQSQPDFDTNTQAILDYIASLAPELNAWVGAYVQDTSSASSTSNSVGTGSKTFTVEAGKGYKVNMPVRASATTGNYMDGIVTAYSGTSLTVNFTAATGSGTFTSWQIFLTIPGSNVTLGSNTFTGDQFVPDEAYDATGWNGDLSVPTKNAIRDKIEAILSAILNATNDPTFSSVSSTDSVSAEWVRGLALIKTLTAQTTSGASLYDFTIPSGAKRVTLMLNQVSTNGTSQIVARLGDSGGIVSSGVTSVASVIEGTSAGSANNSTGFILENASTAAFTRTGTIVFNHVGGNLWTMNGTLAVFGAANPRLNNSAGSVQLSSALTTLRLTTLGGSDVFDLGSINATYEF